MTTLKGVFPNLTTTRKKNFIQENMKNLRRMEHCFHTTKAVDDLQITKHQKTANKYSNITAKVNTSFRGGLKFGQMGDVNLNKETETTEKDQFQNISTPTLDKKTSVPQKKQHELLTNKYISKQKKKESTDVKNVLPPSKAKVTSDPNFLRKSGEDENNTSWSSPIKYKNQSIQTLEEKHIDRLYTEGIIRYPTKGNTKNSEEQSKNESNVGSNSLEKGDMEISNNAKKTLELSATDEKMDIVKLNKDRNFVANKIAMQLNNGVVPPNYRKGVVPKYDVKNTSRFEKKLGKKKKKPKQLHTTLTVQKAMSPYRTMNARRPYVC